MRGSGSTDIFSNRMTTKSYPDSRNFRRIKLAGKRKNNLFAYVDALTSFDLKFRMEKVGRDRRELSTSSLRDLFLLEEEGEF